MLGKKQPGTLFYCVVEVEFKIKDTLHSTHSDLNALQVKYDLMLNLHTSRQ